MCLLIVNIDSFCVQKGKSYYPEVFLKECKYVIKEKKMPKYIDYAEMSLNKYFDDKNLG